MLAHFSGGLTAGTAFLWGQSMLYLALMYRLSTVQCATTALERLRGNTGNFQRQLVIHD